MMTEVKRTDAPIAAQITQPQPVVHLRYQPSPDLLRLIAIGKPEVVNSCVLSLFQLDYARPEEWSQLLPTVNPGEVMRILTKRIVCPD